MEESKVNEFRILEKLGEGSYADVYKVKSVKNQNIYAEKRLKKRYRSFEEVSQLIEVSALRMLSKHPNIIGLHSLMYDSQSGHVALIFELMEMNLLEFMSKEQSMNEKTVLLLMYQLTKAISFVHSKGIFHRDIKPENCLVNSETLELKLADFGSVSSIANRTRFTEYVATRWYRAPECILTSGAYGPSVDVWAVGCVFFEVLTGRPLFPGKHQLDQLNKIHAVLGTPSRDMLAQFQENSKVGFAFPQRQKQSFRSLLPNANEQIVDLLEKMIVYDPSDRITSDEALRHPVFRELYEKDQQWQNSDRSVPFAMYALHGDLVQIQKPAPKAKHSVSFSNINTGPGVHIGERTQFKAPDATTQKQSSFVAQQVQSQVMKQLQKQEVPDVMPKPVPLLSVQQPKQKQIVNPSEARKMAAQRIMDYNKRHVMAQAKMGGKTLGRTQGMLAQKNPSMFQKPRPDMVQPRLPVISFQPLKKM